jgi:N-acetylated-alpha-linked acidic dipeptidase
MRASVILVVSSLILAAGALAAPSAAPAVFGFAPEVAPAEQAAEQRFDAQIDPAQMAEWLKRLSAEPNQVGSPHDRANAEWVRDQFRQWGWNAQIETFEVLYPTLKHHLLELTAPTRFVAGLVEIPIPGDDTSARADAMPPYNVYGADGDVTAELVYVNYGMDEDYRDLARRGVDVKGKIVIARYGGGFRGLKPKLAQEHGAVGCIIYSDPRDDGYGQGDVYPKGGWRPPGGVQLGSVADTGVYAGDPLTPGIGSTPGARRIPIEQARVIMKIPVMPISYADAQPLLAAIAGPLASPAWRGGLPFAYHLGPGPATVHMVVSSDWSQKPVYDVIAKIAGVGNPDEWVVRANHRDAWVYGAWDPLSGHVVMMAEAKAIGDLLRTGWRPRRTLVYASWDGEEANLLGSTEWAETHAEELQRKAVVYINTDDTGRGFLRAGGSHSLQHLVNDVAAAVPDPETGVSIEARSRANLMAAGYGRSASERQRRDARLAASGADLPIEALGTGSDFTPFLQHLGVASLNLQFTGEEDQGGVYHSAYDTFEHYSRFGDPGEKYGAAAAQTVGRLVLRMADADVLPLQFSAFAGAISEYVAELHRLADDRRREAEELAKLLEENAFGLASDPTRRVGPPALEPEVPYFEFAPLDNVATRLGRSARAYDDQYARVASGTLQLSATQKSELNNLLHGMERTLTDDRGLPGREWYKHLVYAPGTLTGYAAKTLPGIREGIEQNRFDEANRYIPITAAVLSAYCDRLDRATALLRNAAVTAPAARHAALAFSSPAGVAGATGVDAGAGAAQVNVTRQAAMLAAANEDASSTHGSAATHASVEALRTPLRPQHIFIIMLENQSYGTTFGERSGAPYLARMLPSQGALLPNYYAIGHSSLPNYIALIAGQAPNRDTQLDCPVFSEFQVSEPALDAHGQALGRGCVYPPIVKSLPDQLEARNLSWRAYMEDMGNVPARENVTCGHVQIGATERSYNAAHSDKYAARHDPFLYFHSIIDDQARCDAHVVNLRQLATDLRSIETTPNYSFITPNLCNDGHDPYCIDGEAGGMAAADDFLRRWVASITSSPAFRKDGLLVVTFDETDMIGPEGSTACCGERPLASATRFPPGLNGPGGGRVGAVLISPFIRPGTVSLQPYNHYSLLRSVEDFFGLERLGYAAEPDLRSLGADVFTGP